MFVWQQALVQTVSFSSPMHSTRCLFSFLHVDVNIFLNLFSHSMHFTAMNEALHLDRLKLGTASYYVLKL